MTCTFYSMNGAVRSAYALPKEGKATKDRLLEVEQKPHKIQTKIPNREQNLTN